MSIVRRATCILPYACWQLVERGIRKPHAVLSEHIPIIQRNQKVPGDTFRRLASIRLGSARPRNDSAGKRELCFPTSIVHRRFPIHVWKNWTRVSESLDKSWNLLFEGKKTGKTSLWDVYIFIFIFNDRYLIKKNNNSTSNWKRLRDCTLQTYRVFVWSR